MRKYRTYLVSLGAAVLAKIVLSWVCPVKIVSEASPLLESARIVRNKPFQILHSRISRKTLWLTRFHSLLTQSRPAFQCVGAAMICHCGNYIWHHNPSFDHKWNGPQFEQGIWPHWQWPSLPNSGKDQSLSSSKASELLAPPKNDDHENPHHLTVIKIVSKKGLKRIHFNSF